MAMAFNGSNNYVTLASKTNWDWAAASYTVGMWVYNISNKDSGGQGPIQIGKMVNNSPAQYWSFGTKANGLVEWYYYNGSIQRVSGTTTIPLSTWTLLTMSLSGTTITLYINGILEKTGTKVGTPLTDGSTPLIFGANHSTYYNGRIDEVKIFNRALTAAEILSMYNHEKGKFSVGKDGTMKALEFVEDPTLPVQMRSKKQSLTVKGQLIEQ